MPTPQQCDSFPQGGDFNIPFLISGMFRDSVIFTHLTADNTIICSSKKSFKKGIVLFLPPTFLIYHVGKYFVL